MNKFLLGIVALFFVFFHLSGVHLPYHQDEYKWKLYSHPEIIPPGTVPHPPLTEFIYTKIGPLVGDENFRFIPFSFGLINLILLYFLVKYLYGEKTAVISSIIFTFSFYSLLASLMVDVDGAVMPFFFLILLHGYFRWKEKNFVFEKSSWPFILLVVLGALGGFMIKVSAILPILAVFLDYSIHKKIFGNWRKIIIYGLIMSGMLAFLGLLLFLSKDIFPSFNLKYSFGYWMHFADSSSFLNRGWFQTLIQCIKSLFYTSPFLVLLPFFIVKEDFKKLRVLFLFLGIAFVFYVVLFDFSIGALDRYWQLVVVPLGIVSSVVIGKTLDEYGKSKKILLGSSALAVVIFLLEFIPHFVPPLHPKTEWIERFVHLKWNFLYPFSGGSGPLGFYVSFLFIALCWIVSVLAVIFSLYKKQYKHTVIFFLIPLGVIYNSVFIEEYLFGYINGSAPRLLEKTIAFIKDNPDIKMVTTYNDNGGNELQVIDKYRRRLYIDPKFDEKIKIETMNKYKEHYLVLNVPRIDPNSVYMKYFATCKEVYKDTDRYISSTVYDCRDIPDFKI
jgi:4-amino-4-deoxy-L-arabinose transferase-like glycosyltransferase